MGSGDVGAGVDEGDAISDALEGASADLDAALPDDAGEELAGGDDAAIEGGITDEALAASIDGALAQADENGTGN